MCWAAPKPPLYIGGRERGRRPRVSPRGAAARADGISPLGDLAPKPGGGNPRWGAPNPLVMWALVGGASAHLGAGPFPLLAHVGLWGWWPHLVDPRTPPVVPVHYR